MSREAEFRAWHKEGYFSYLNLREGGECDFTNLQLADAPFEQFTGLLDRNGRKIYEGDILMTCIGQARVFYDDEYCMWKISAKHGTTMPLVSKKSRRQFDYEIIGNIHELNKGGEE